MNFSTNSKRMLTTEMYFSMSDPGPNAFATNGTKPVSFDK